MKILIAETKDFSFEAIEELKLFAEVVCKDIEPSDLIHSLKYYDVFWFRLKFKLDKGTLYQATACKYIICPVTGLDHIDLEACNELGIKVLSLKNEVDFLKKIRATAELTLGLTITLLRKIQGAINHTKLGEWDRNRFKGSEIFEKSVGILGFGRLGQITASYFKAMGANVLVYDIKPLQNVDYILVSSMNELFELCDIISIHVNYNMNNHHLVGYSQLSRMKKNSFLVNTSRGQVINSYDLIEALRRGYLSGAAVDVLENEFDFANDPLIQFSKTFENLIITPHIGGNTTESFAKTELFMVQKLKSLL